MPETDARPRKGNTHTPEVQALRQAEDTLVHFCQNDFLCEVSKKKSIRYTTFMIWGLGLGFGMMRP